MFATGAFLIESTASTAFCDFCAHCYWKRVIEIWHDVKRENFRGRLRISGTQGDIGQANPSLFSAPARGLRRRRIAALSALARIPEGNGHQRPPATVLYTLDTTHRISLRHSPTLDGQGQEMSCGTGSGCPGPEGRRAKFALSVFSSPLLRKSCSLRAVRAVFLIEFPDLPSH